MKPFLRRAALAGVVLSFGGALLWASSVSSAVERFVDVLDRPAMSSALASKRLLLASAVAGDRLVSAGARGHVVYSDDGGATWRQARVPVSADLTALFFVDAREGWAVGHEGVVLHTADGGATWELQLDGRRANELVLAHVRALAAAAPPVEAAATPDADIDPADAWSEDAATDPHAALLAEAERAQAEGPSRPFLDVWFADANQGWVVGAYNLIFHTADGGATWQPWVDRTDNPGFYHLYGIRGSADGVYVAGELGLALKFDPATGRFAALATGYDGSWFGVLTQPGVALAYGLRGTAHRSLDGGATWTPVDTGVAASLTSGQVLPDGRLLLCSQAGDVVVGDAQAARFARVPLPSPSSCAGIAAAGDALVSSGPRGVRVDRVPY